MAKYNPLKIEQSLPELYPRLVQYVNGVFYDGNGNVITVVKNYSKDKIIISDGTPSGLVASGQLSFSNGTFLIVGDFQLQNGQEEEGYHLVTDENGLSTWTSSRGFYFQSTPPSPTPEKIGSRWVHSETGYEYVWIYDGTNYNWLQPTQINTIPYYTTEINVATFSTDFEYTYYGVGYTAGICTVYLPLGTASIDDGKTITIADEVGGIKKYNRGINVIPSGTQSINGYSNITMKVDNMSLTFLFRGGEWKTI